MITMQEIAEKKEILRLLWKESKRDRETLIRQAKLLDMAKERLLKRLPPQQILEYEKTADKTSYED